MSKDATENGTPGVPPGGSLLGRVLLWLFALGALGAIAILIVLRAQEERKVTKSSTVPTVRVQRPTLRDLLVRLAYPAELRAIQEAEIRPVEAKGFVTRLTVDKGDRVRRGQLLARVDCPEYHDRRRQALAAIRSVAATEKNARALLARLQPMVGRRFVSQMEIDDAEAAVDRSFARKKNEEAKLAEVDALLAYCTIRAPFSGEVLVRHVDTGAQVRPGGGPLLTLVRRNAIRIQLQVVARDARLVRIGLPAELAVQGLEGRRFHGRVTRFARSVDPGTGTQMVEIQIPNRDQVLKPGMFGRVVLTVDRHPRAVIVPATAVLATDEGTSVYVVEKGRARRVRVRTGEDLGDELEILEGLRGNEALVIAGRDMVSDGLPVKTVE